MSDRLKFRAWDECNKIMHYDFQFIRDWSNGGWIIFQSDKQKLDWNTSDKFTLNVYPNPYFAEQLKIMQCTGLKDKNGKLIYEGDIVAFMNPYENDKLMAIIVNWESTPIVTGFNFGEEFAKNVEIIGNKFENPGLLKECE